MLEWLRQRRITVLNVTVVIVQAAVWYAAGFLPSPLRELITLAVGGSLVCTIYLAHRRLLFAKKLTTALQHLLENNYQTGISDNLGDEYSALAAKFNRVVEQLAAYDTLRQQAVEQRQRMLTLVFRYSRDSILLFEPDAGWMKLNRGAQELFDIAQDELSIDSVIKLEANQQLAACYSDILQGRANTMAVDMVIALPILKARAAVSMKMIAVKDADEHVCAIVCFCAKNGSV